MEARTVTPGSSHRFVVATEQHDSGARVVSVMGEVDPATAPALEQTLRAVAEDRPGEVIIDLSGCSFFDSTGLHALASTSARLRDSDTPLSIVLSNPSVLRVFEITGFDEQFAMYPSVPAAVNGNGNGNGRG